MRPELILAASDRAALEKTALEAILRSPRVAGFLLEEVDRAQVVADCELADDVVRLGSWVEVRDDLTGVRQRVRLALGAPSAIHPREVSVLTPMGAALIGLRVGQSIVCEDRVGTRRLLTVVAAYAD